MRWFWLFILSLGIVTGALYAQRTSAERAERARLEAEAESARESVPPRRPRRQYRAESQQEFAQLDPEPAVTDQTEPGVSESIAAQTEESVGEQAESEPTDIVQNDTQDDPSEIDDLLIANNEISEHLPPEENQSEPPTTEKMKPAQAEGSGDPDPVADPSPAPVGEIVIDLPAEPEAQTPEPTYEQRADGSFRVLDANVWVQGAGTPSEPYVLTWDVLRSIEKHYNPKSGKDTLPDWLDLLDGKTVIVEGNTLVPVVASTTRELLVMQNPWDGCCIGVPPTPYDAVEVSLNHDVDFGNSAVGFGSVQGTFYVDPYVVDGWVLGVYVIEDAKYRSGEGVVFPEF